MSIEISSKLKIVLDAIKEKCSTNSFTNRHDFVELLRSLNAVEKYVVARCFCKSTWNVGSLKTLSILQELRILSAKEFILSQGNSDHIQLILNDFLEREFELFTNICVSAFYDSTNSIKLTTILDECLHNLFEDLLKNPELSDLQYMKTLKETLPRELLIKITNKHIDILLELHKSSIRQAFRNFSTWINEGVNNIKFMNDFYSQLIGHISQETISYLLKVSSSDHFKEWKFYLILMQTIASKSLGEGVSYVKKYLKNRLRQMAAVPCKKSMSHMLLTARAITATTMDVDKNIDAYADWYKQNISDMKFVLTKEEFQNVLSLLEQCIDMEAEQSYLEIHCVISISPPVLCGKLVQGYKVKCKQRLSQLKRRAKGLEENSSDENEVMIINDDDDD